jgi:predicted nucleic acid-binding protein
MLRNTGVVYDACVLYPAPLRDLLMQLAAYAQNKHWFRAKWTDEINNEWIENLLIRRPDLKREALDKTKSLMNSTVDDCLVIDYGPLIGTLTLPDQNDRHVLAAAIQAKATIIVTANIRDFPSEVLDKYGIEAMIADDFICSVVDEFGEDGAAGLAVIATIVKNRLKNPPIAWSDYLANLATLSGNELPNTVAKIQSNCEQEWAESEAVGRELI